MGLIMPVTHLFEPYGAEEKPLSIKLKKWVAILALKIFLARFQLLKIVE